MAGGVVDVRSGTWEREVLKADGLVAVLFWAPWCEPCMQMVPAVEEFARESVGTKVVKLNVDENDDVASTYLVSILPTVMFFREGQKRREVVTNVSRAQLAAASEGL